METGKARLPVTKNIHSSAEKKLCFGAESIGISLDSLFTSLLQFIYVISMTITEGSQQQQCCS